jgi:DNA-binding response OmpR family regulator
MSDTPVKILIIDDEPALLRMMSLFLGRKGFSVAVAGSASLARRELTSGYDVAVVDATLRDTSLFTFGTEILNAYPGTRLLAASGYPVDMSGLEAVAPGRVAFLHKPFSPEMLLAAVRRLLGAQEEGL